jgi:hypothetical protein
MHNKLSRCMVTMNRLQNFMVFLNGALPLGCVTWEWLMESTSLSAQRPTSIHLFLKSIQTF